MSKFCYLRPFLGVFLVFQLQMASAANYVMSTSDGIGTSSFNTGTDWVGGLAPSVGNTYQTGPYILRTPGNSTAITFAGVSLEVQNGGNLRDKTVAAVTVTNVILDGGGIIDLSAASGSLNGNITLSGGLAYISAGGGQVLTCNSTISGAGGFYTYNAVSAGAGTIILTGDNPFTGGIIVNAGTLQSGYTAGDGDSPLGIATPTINAGGTLIGGAGDAFGYWPGNAPTNFNIVGGTITELSTASYRLTMPNITFTGGTLTSPAGNNGDGDGNYSFFGMGGPTVVTTFSNATTAVISAQEITLQQNNQATGTTIFNTAAGSITNGSTPGVDLWITSHLADFGGEVSTLAKVGPGTMALDATNTYSGGTLVGGGTLQLGTTNDTAALTSALGTGSVVVSNNAVLSFGSSQSIVLTVPVSGAGALAVSNGTAVLTTANTYSGPTTVAAGTLIVSNTAGSATGTGNVTVNNGAVLGGIGIIGGNVTVAGKTFPGTGGVTNTINGNLTYVTGGEADFNLNTSAVGGGNDQIILNGAASVLNGGNVNVGIRLAGASLDQANDYTLFNMTGGSASIAGNFIITPLWLGTTPGNASQYSVVTVGNRVLLHYSTTGTTNLPVVANAAASGITFTGATLNGQVVSTGGQYPTVRVYYGTSDGGTNPANWTTSLVLGLEAGTFATTLSNLTINTTYYFTASASNSAGTAWATPSKSFATLALNLATITNLPASNIQGSSAILNGQVLSTGNQTPNVTLYYGTNNGGTNAVNWANNIYLGQQSGAFNVTVAGLVTNTTYYYAAAAVNNAGTAWGKPSVSFTTLPTATYASVLTYHNDNGRTGANTNETLLTPGNVNTNNFGLLFQYAVDGFVFAQPLYVPNLAIPGQGTHNVLFIATEHNSIYALDADNNSGVNGGILWHTNLGTAPQSNNHEFGDRYNNNNYIDLTPEVGITGTPVIDPVGQFIYVDVLTREVTTRTNYYHRIHALSLTTGTEPSYSPVVVTGSVPGKGVGGNGSVVTFNPQQHNQRPALTLAGGKLFVAYGSFADTDPYHGWVMGFTAANLQPLANGVFCTTPNATTTGPFGANAGEGALWAGGNGLCVDASTNLYFETANGSFSANTNGGDYGDTFVKLSTTNGLKVADYFTPYDQQSLADADTDLGSGGAILLPDSVGSATHPHLIIGGGKAGKVYSIDRDNMGHFNAAGDTQIVESFGANAGSFFGSPAYFNYAIYYHGKGGVMRTFVVTNGFISTTASSSTSNSYAGYGVTPSVSANGTNNGIVWDIQTDGSSPSDTGAAVLHAYNATNLALEIYNTSQNSGRDNPGPGVKYTVPTIANGKVYLGAQFLVSVFGTTTFLATPSISPNGLVYTNSVLVSLSDATPGATIYYTLDGTVPTTNSFLYTAPFAVSTTVNLQAIAMKPGAANSGIASASFVNSAAVGNGLGLLGRYWTNTTASAFTNVTFNTLPTLTRTDAVVNFNWSTNAPDASIGRTNFVVRWTGSLQPQYTETYKFFTTADDGARLFVNGQLLINDWADKTNATTASNSIALVAQQLYNVELDYYQKTSNASITLAWSSPSTAQAPVPASQLYPYTNPPPTVVLLGPGNNSTYTANASVTVSADADALYNPLTAVNFYANSSFLGSVTSPPYSITASGLGAGAYALTAVAVDGSGLSSTSALVNITVNPGTGQPYGITNRSLAQAFLNMPTTYNGALPALVSLTGIFSNTTNMTPVSSLIPYMPNTPLWSDGALKTRYFSVPNTGGVVTASEQIAFVSTNSWTFPAGTVFVKTFELNTDTTNPNVRHRLETRLLVRDINGAVYGVTYKWRADNSDADLLSSSLIENIQITNATGISTQMWYYPSPADCLTCHTPAANYVLGVSSRQLNGSLTYPGSGVTDNQLRTLNQLGLFSPAFDEASITNFEKLSALTNLTASLEERVRSYLDANCAQCHRPGGTGITFDARYDTPLNGQSITNFPASFSLGYDRACIVKAQDIWRSMIYERMNTTNPATKMPPLARNLIDTNAVAVITAWINSLPGLPALAPPAIAPNGGTFFATVGVALHGPDTNAALYYSLDGSLPTTNSLLYTGPFTISNNVTVNANAFETGYDNSVAASALFNVFPLQLSSPGFVSNGQFQLSFAGIPGSNYVLQATTNFVTWVPIATNVAGSNVFNFMDVTATNYPDRFYRVLQQ